VATTEPGELLTVAEAAKLLQRSTEQVRRYLREGVLPGRRLGGQWFIDRAEAAAFLSRRPSGDEFQHKLAVSDPDPLGATLAIGGSGGGDVARGRVGYLQSLLGDRRS
jgi:excisionase family DNA binding protein